MDVKLSRMDGRLKALQQAKARIGAVKESMELFGPPLEPVSSEGGLMYDRRDERERELEELCRRCSTWSKVGLTAARVNNAFYKGGFVPLPFFLILGPPVAAAAVGGFFAAQLIAAPLKHLAGRELARCELELEAQMKEERRALEVSSLLSSPEDSVDFSFDENRLWVGDFEVELHSAGWPHSTGGANRLIRRAKRPEPRCRNW